MHLAEADVFRRSTPGRGRRGGGDPFASTDSFGDFFLDGGEDDLSWAEGQLERPKGKGSREFTIGEPSSNDGTEYEWSSDEDDDRPANGAGTHGSGSSVESDKEPSGAAGAKTAEEELPAATPTSGGEGGKKTKSKSSSKSKREKDDKDKSKKKPKHKKSKKKSKEKKESVSADSGNPQSSSKKENSKQDKNGRSERGTSKSKSMKEKETTKDDGESTEQGVSSKLSTKMVSVRSTDSAANSSSATNPSEGEPTTKTMTMVKAPRRPTANTSSPSLPTTDDGIKLLLPGKDSFAECESCEFSSSNLFDSASGFRSYPTALENIDSKFKAVDEVTATTTASSSVSSSTAASPTSAQEVFKQVRRASINMTTTDAPTAPSPTNNLESATGPSTGGFEHSTQEVFKQVRRRASLTTTDATTTPSPTGGSNNNNNDGGVLDKHLAKGRSMSVARARSTSTSRSLGARDDLRGSRHSRAASSVTLTKTRSTRAMSSQRARLGSAPSVEDLFRSALEGDDDERWSRSRREQETTSLQSDEDELASSHHSHDGLGGGARRRVARQTLGRSSLHGGRRGRLAVYRNPSQRSMGLDRQGSVRSLASSVVPVEEDFADFNQVDSMSQDSAEEFAEFE